MQKLIRNNWNREPGQPYAAARILDRRIHPEGLDLERIRFMEMGSIAPECETGHIVSVLRGAAALHVVGAKQSDLQLQENVHLYLPPGGQYILRGEAGTELLWVKGASPSQARGKRLLLRDEMFVAACAAASQSLRWAFTPQYLSRRIFLHHDETLLSKSGNPVSWFRTTMFDVAGLPESEDGLPVFKMSYNSRTEVNVCYDVKGSAMVRMAHHPYRLYQQLWSPWYHLDGDSTYHLNEAAGSPEEEWELDHETSRRRFLRNKHEVHIAGGHVTLFCMFDPAPTGVENHRTGEYSDYEPLSEVLGTREYEIHRREISRYDDMVERLSLARAVGQLEMMIGTPAWELYMEGKQAQAEMEAGLLECVACEAASRRQVLKQWSQPVPHASLA